MSVALRTMLSVSIAKHIEQLVRDDQLLSSITNTTIREDATDMPRVTVTLILHPQDMAEIIARAAGQSEVVMARFRGQTRDETPTRPSPVMVTNPGLPRMNYRMCPTCEHLETEHGIEGCTRAEVVNLSAEHVEGRRCQCKRQFV